jgi:hypothetical protein
MKRTILTIFSILLVISLSGCQIVNRISLYEGSHKGRVVDADTGEPIEGVVVLGVWETEWPSPGGGVTSYYDTREAVSDKQGEFSVPGLGVRIVINLLPMRPIIFKAGYEYLEFYWDTESLNDEKACGVSVRWDGKVPIIPLRKLSLEERKKGYSPRLPHSEASYENVKFYLKEWNKDRVERGVKPLADWGGVKL